MNRYLIILILPSLFFIACGDNLPTGTEQNFFTRYDTSLTDNSFLLNGGGYKDARIDMSGGTLEDWSLRTDGGMTALLETDLIELPGKTQEIMMLVLQFPSSRGTFTWDNLFEKAPDSTTVHMAATIAGKKYISLEGTTEVIFVRDVFYEITGKYSGRLASAFGDTITISDGRFSVQSNP